MDRSKRMPIFEPILLILKQRTGIASILAVLVAVLMFAAHRDSGEVAMTITPILMYVGKQTLLDAKEASDNLTKEVVDVLEVLGVVEKEKEEPTEIKLNG